ncbi:MAG: 2-amino-4-hydroxy-6-hydroxymethyldihydropteridine diphosphokinase [Candidatus Neomarinimicrobiota bacterium]
MPEKVILSLGSNLGDRESRLQAAADLLAGTRKTTMIAASDLYETEPVGVPTPQTNYLNQVLVLETDLTPEQLLWACQAIELALGRPDDHQPLSPRTIDIDLIAYGALVVSTPTLTLPHPRYHQRRFVLEPLAEVRPQFEDPRSGCTVTVLLEECRDGARVIRRRAAEVAAC